MVRFCGLKCAYFKPTGAAGKGIWDGIGGAVKQSIRNDILFAKRTDGKGRTPLSTSKKLSTPFDCYEHYRNKKMASASGADATKFQCLWADSCDIARPKFTEVYDRFHGIRCARQVLAGPNEGVVAWRKFACWCPACFAAIGHGKGSMDTKFRVPKCSSTGPDYVWHEQSVRKIDEYSITQERIRAQTQGRKIASKLTKHDLGKWVAVQNRGDEADPTHFWLGRLVDCGKGHPVLRKFTKSETLANMRFHAGDHAVAVEWFERAADDEEDRTFYPGDAGMQLFNSTELRMFDFSPVQTVEVRPLRGRNNRQQERWVLKAEDEVKILGWCW